MTFVSVGDDEQLCSACRGDLRRFKRTIDFYHLFSEEFNNPVAREASTAAQQAAKDVLDGYYDVNVSELVKSNAENPT